MLHLFRGKRLSSLFHNRLISTYTTPVRSQRQWEILHENRDSAILFINNCLPELEDIGMYEKGVILQLNGYECIAGLLKIFTKNNDLIY